MLKISKEILRVDFEIEESEILDPFFDLFGPVIGEKIKISKKETKKPSKEHDFTHV